MPRETLEKIQLMAPGERFLDWARKVVTTNSPLSEENSNEMLRVAECMRILLEKTHLKPTDVFSRDTDFSQDFRVGPNIVINETPNGKVSFQRYNIIHIGPEIQVNYEVGSSYVYLTLARDLNQQIVKLDVQHVNPDSDTSSVEECHFIKSDKFFTRDRNWHQVPKENIQ